MKELVLSDEEITELASVFAPGPEANLVLRKARFPREAVPAVQGSTGLQFWTQVGIAVENGILPDGRRRILTAALELFRHNQFFQQALGESGVLRSQNSPPLRVLVIGAGTGDPDGKGRNGSVLRADRETKLILDAVGERLAVDVRPAATIDDLSAVLKVRPDIIHLVCHGDGEVLTFADAYGEPHPVLAAHVASLLAAYTESANLRPAGLVLNACRSAEIAEPFARIADTVIAHRGSLDDDCAQLFAQYMYGALRDGSSIRSAAQIAGELLRADGSGCDGVLAGLVVLRADGGDG